MAKPTQARTSDITLAEETSNANFRRIGRSLKVMSLLSPVSPDNVLGEEQQLRTDPEPCRFCRFAIDFEADLISFQAKSDHSADAQKTICLPYGENWRVPKIRQ